jgi:hypothetical protein
MILQFSQSFLIEARTFIVSAFFSFQNAPVRQIAGRNLNDQSLPGLDGGQPRPLRAPSCQTMSVG